MRNFFFVILLTTFLSTTILSGCTVLKNKIDNSQVPEADREPLAKDIEHQILTTAKSIEGSLTTLAAAQEAESPEVINTLPLITPEGGMGGKADIDWTGPIAPLLDKISKMTNYRLKTLGNEPAIPIVVTIAAKNAVVADIVKNAGLQATKRAQVLVFPESRVIELRYLAP